ncbi:MAG: PEP-CTERM system histidine kinase PrsK [Rhodospirillaceae bacterium]|nr:PEP-CTERM system histidine kinase PrsK [Rhodospirillaceae bacterium]
MINAVIFISYAVAAIAFLAAAGLLAVSRAQHRYKALMLAASVMTGVWALAVVASGLTTAKPLRMSVVVLEQLRSLAWIAVLGFVLFIAYRKRVEKTVVALMAGAVVAATGYVLAVAAYGALTGELSELAARLSFIARIVLAVVGLLLVENLFRNSGAEARWAVKNLCFGAGVLFIFDFYIYAEAALFGVIDAQTYAARGFIDSLAAPFIVLAAGRAESWPIDLHVSRQMVFRSATLLAAGCYLIVMSMVGFSLRALDGAWGTVTQAVFLTSAALLLMVILSSGKVQARGRAFISRNFFSYKYDYRKEWLQFIAAVSDSSSELKMPDRVIRALANIVESTGGALWMPRDGVFRVAASFNMGNGLPVFANDDPFVEALGIAPGVLALETGEVDGAPAAIPVPQGLREHNRSWLVLPLLHAGGLIGIALLAQPRTDVQLSWEDFELLKTAGRQAASYIAEDEAAQSLARLRRFEDFNRHFAFVVHDIKNLAGQMSLMVKNAERYGDNPEFQKDMLRTVGHCSARMRTLLEQIKSRTAAPASKVAFDLTERLSRLARTWRLQIARLRTDVPKEKIQLQGDPDKLDTVLNHLLQNALDATGAQGDIALEAKIDQGQAVICVSDDGPGMDRAFIENKLFQPLTTVKASGFGIGAFQTRQLIQELGGQLDVESEIGRGTRMIVRLPLSGASEITAASESGVPKLKVING